MQECGRAGRRHQAWTRRQLRPEGIHPASAQQCYSALLLAIAPSMAGTPSPLQPETELEARPLAKPLYTPVGAGHPARSHVA